VSNSPRPPADALIQVGRVGRPHGLDGSFFVEDASDDPARFAVGARLYVRGEPARVVSSKSASGRPVIRLEPPVDRGEELQIPRAELPDPGANAYYAFQLVGLEVVEESGAVLGRVQEVEPGVANDVLALDSGLALPMHEACVREIDLSAGRITVAPGFADST
jgi:16S rRNA processing protein RimM